VGTSGGWHETRAVRTRTGSDKSPELGLTHRVYPHKTFTPPILELESAHEGKEVTAVAWGTDAKYLLSAGMDRIMRVYSE
jgi:hypothetical protein